MVDTLVQNELLKQMEQLPVAMQHQVLDFARSLVKPTPKGTPGRELLRFAGIMTPEEGKDFLRSIEEDCERIDPNEW
jgi:hypothetical protein